MKRVQGPLTGITIVDLTRVVAGPYCTMLLSELGARVIKIEEPGRGDDCRHFGPFVQGRPSYFNSLNRSKESIALDLRRPEDREIFDALIERADVLVENFRPGVMDKLGYGWETVHARLPRLIYASISGPGQTGPKRSNPGYDTGMQGLSGPMSITGEPGGEPCRAGISVADVGTGVFSMGAINAALLHRERTGEAMRVDMAMFDVMLTMLETPISRYQMSGEIAGPMGSMHPSIMPFETFGTKDGRVTLACGNDKLFGQFCDLIGRPEMARHPDYKTNALRVANRPALRAEIESELIKDTAVAWTEKLEPLGIPIGPINNVAEALADPQVAARNMLVEMIDPVLGPVKAVGNPFKLSPFQPRPDRSVAPELDEHREALLGECLHKTHAAGLA